MMGVLIVDTETTGLPFYGADNPADAPWQPRMCSIAMALITEKEKDVTIDKYHCLIRPEGWPLDDERFVANMEQAREKAHGLTLEDLMKDGVPIAEAHAKWQEFYAKARFVCGYNVWFDHKIIRGEWRRLGHPIPFREKQAICLMKAARPACGLGKNPKLGEAVKLLLNREHGAAHTAAGDVEVCIDLYLLFHELEQIHPEDQPEAKVKP
jgi:DNA polymerase III epsilon subunit-like protein